MQLTGAKVIVTGSSHGIGRETALSLAQRGAVVIGVGRDAGALAEVDRLTGGISVRCDVSDPQHATVVLDRVLAEYGRVDAAVLNAGIGWAGAFDEMPPEKFPALLDTNVLAPAVLAAAIAPRLREQRSGAIVFVTSIAGLLPVPGEALYSASKNAMEAFADAIREELRSSGVTVSSVSPGVVATDFFDARGRPYDRRWPRPIPAQRIASAIVDVLQSGKPQRTVPRWLGLPPRLRGMSPGLYRTLSRLGT